MRKLYNLIITSLLLSALMLSCNETETGLGTSLGQDHICPPCTVCASHTCPVCTVCADHVCATCTCPDRDEPDHVCPSCEVCANHVCLACETCANHVCATCPNNCSPPLPPVDLITIKADAELISSQTRVYYEDNVQSIDYFWSENDSVTVCFKHEDDGIYNEWETFNVESSDGGKAIFTAQYNPLELENFPSPRYKYLWAISPAVERVNDSRWSHRIMCDASQQTMTDGLLDLSAAYFTARSEYVVGETASFKFEPRMTLMTFAITLPAEFDRTLINEFKVQGNGLYDTRVISIEEAAAPYFKWKDVTEGDITISFKGTLPIEGDVLTVSMMVFPTTEIGAIRFNIVDGSNINFFKELTITTELETGKSYKYELGFSQPGLETALDDRGLNIGTLRGADNEFLTRYAFNDNRTEITFTYLDNGTLVHKTVSTTLETDNISWEAITLPSGDTFGQISYDNSTNILTPSSATTTLMSQKNVVGEMVDIATYLWAVPANAAASNGDQRIITVGGAKAEFNAEYENDITVSDIRLRNSGEICFFGYTNMRDIIYTKIVNQNSSSSDIITYSATQHGGDNNSTVSEYVPYDGSGRLYHLAIMPATHAAWFDEAGLIVVKDERSYFLLSPTTANWFKFTLN